LTRNYPEIENPGKLALIYKIYDEIKDKI